MAGVLLKRLRLGSLSKLFEALVLEKAQMVGIKTKL